MTRSIARLVLLTGVLLSIGMAAMAARPFGGPQDREFARKLWQEMEGYRGWSLQSEVYEGMSPHGAYLQMFASYVTIDGEPYLVIVKDNHGGPELTAQDVRRDPDAHLKAVTVMVQREEGYDPDHNDWFWVKYAPDGTISENAQGASLAGRVAKGADTGCISCHHRAGGGDYLFSNDRD